MFILIQCNVESGYECSKCNYQNSYRSHYSEIYEQNVVEYSCTIIGRVVWDNNDNRIDN